MLAIKGATVVNFDPPTVREGVDILIEGNQIHKVGAGLASDPGVTEVIDATGKIVHPGLVCSHSHIYSCLARGILADIPPSPDFVSVLQNLWWRLDRALDRDSLHYSVMTYLIDAVRSGTTSVIDHHASPSFIDGSLAVLRRAFLEVGVRGMTCYETTDRNGGIGEVEAGVAENIAFAQLIESERGEVPDLVESHIGAHAPFTVPDEGLGLLADAVEKSGRGLHIHAAEDRYDPSHSHAHYHQGLTGRLDSFGLLTPRTIIAHGIFLGQDDIERLNKRDTFLAHNSRSNMNNNVGYNQNLANYDNVAIGTDGIGGDMFEEVKFAYFKHRDSGGELWPDSYLRFLHNGNRLLERNFSGRFGSIDEGYRADLVISQYTAPTPLLPENIAGHIAFGMSSRDVESVIIEGRVVYRERSFPFKLDDIYSGAREAAQRLWKRMDSL